MKALLLIIGILVATAGGVITYRALYVEPKSGVVITDTGIRQIPNQARVVGGALIIRQRLRARALRRARERSSRKGKSTKHVT